MSRRIEDKKTGLILSNDYNRLSVKVSYWIIFTLLIVWSVAALLPVVWAFLSGFKEIDEFYSTTPSFFPKNMDFSRIKAVWNDMRLGGRFVNTVVMFAGVWISEVLIGGVAGYTMSRLKPAGSKYLFMLIMWTMMMPQTVTMVPKFLMYIDVPFFHWNLQNTYVPFWLSAMANAYNIVLFKSFFDTIPLSYIESAKIDGCSNAGIYTKIIMPLSKPIIATITIFVFNGVWNNFLMPYLLIKDTSLYTVALGLYTIRDSWTEPFQMLAAFIVIVPPIIIFLMCSRQILSSNVNVGVKE